MPAQRAQRTQSTQRRRAAGHDTSFPARAATSAFSAFTPVMFAAISWMAVPPASAQVRLTQQEALRLAFPEPAVIARRTAFLADTQLAEARQLAGPDVEILQGVVTYYEGRRNDSLLGRAYFDAHRVRSLREVLMIVVGPDDRIRRIEVLAFREPPDYFPPDAWVAQVEGRALSRDLSLKGAVVPMTGATLTSQAVVHAARRVLALHAVIPP